MRVSIAAAALVFLAAGVALTALTHDPWPTNDGIALVVLTAYAAVGYVIARAEPRNPIGWMFLALGFFTLFDYLMKLYLVLDYRDRGGRLPLGHAAEFWQSSWSIFALILALPAVVLFPDGSLSRRWRRFMWVYAGAGVIFMMLQVAGQIVDGSGRIVVDVRGTLPNSNGGWVAGAGWLLGPVLPCRLVLLRRAPGRGLALLDRSPESAAEVAGGRECSPRGLLVVLLMLGDGVLARVLASPPTWRRSASASCRLRSGWPSCGSASTRSTG